MEKLDNDMTRQGVMTVPKGHCAACAKPIVGQVELNHRLYTYFLKHPESLGLVAKTMTGSIHILYVRSEGEGWI